ncbi:type II secretion system protein [bacterium]|nr:type II secretion system protein [bacterium]
MNTKSLIGRGVKSSCGHSFRLLVEGFIRTLRHYGSMAFYKVSSILSYLGNKALDFLSVSVLDAIVPIAKKTQKIIAFTLAETLIVIGVIGIVSALTLPNLNSSTGEKEKVAKVKKIYQNLQDAFGRAEAVYGPYGEWLIGVSGDQAQAKRIGERMTEFMKLSKTCGVAANQGCWTATAIKCRNGRSQSGKPDENTNSYKVITADGTSLILSSFSGGSIQVDIDGPSKGPNKLGSDVFSFLIDNSLGVIPKGTSTWQNGTLTFESLLSDLMGYGHYCTLWVVNYDNADYLKFSSVSGSTATCTGGTANAVTETHPRCK